MNKLLLVFLLCLVTAEANDVQTFYIYEDNELHSNPANIADIELEKWVSPSWVESGHYAGAIWGPHDLSDREYCIAWAIRSSDEFDGWLGEQDYRRKVILEE